ncbi:MAG: hypothetical protein PUE51_05810 [Veillonellaceae bacterium]|nr:hypothetical protein [Veillonellaceae bacterium]
MIREWRRNAITYSEFKKDRRRMLAENRNARRVKRSNQLAWAYQVICEADLWNSVLQRDRETFTALDVHGKAIEISRAQYEKFVDEAKSGRKQSIDDPDDF